MILVTGATGTVGRQLVAELVAGGVGVRALSRTPEQAGLPARVEVVAGDLGRPETLGAALEGVERVFLLSGGPEGPSHDTNLIGAAKQAGVAHVVTLSVLGAGHGADDPITRWHLAGERAVAGSGMAWTVLRPGAFISNALMWAPTIKTQDAIYAPFAQAKTAAIDPADIAAVAARALTEPGHENKTYPLTGPELLSAADQVETLGAALGRPLRLVDVPPEAAKAAMVESGMPAELADAVIASMAQAGTDHAMAVLPTVEKVTGRPARSFAEWTAAHLENFR
jgi:(4-alkanoyl-5-oxo-2,5-dihydrofuran-3-yl)methyl phosphate reductase